MNKKCTQKTFNSLHNQNEKVEKKMVDIKLPRYRFRAVQCTHSACYSDANDAHVGDSFDGSNYYYYCCYY